MGDESDEGDEGVSGWRVDSRSGRVLQLGPSAGNGDEKEGEDSKGEAVEVARALLSASDGVVFCGGMLLGWRCLAH
jgi:hypothetical protein